MTKRKTHEEFVKEVYDLVGNEYTVIGRYTINREKVEMRHNNCNHMYKVQAASFLQGKRCPECNRILNSKRKRKSHETFLVELFKIKGTEYTVNDIYENWETKLEFTHNKCGNKFLMRPSDILAGCGCPKCFGTFRKTTEQFREEVFSLVGNEYEVIGDYVNRRIQIKIQHDVCGIIYSVLPGNFLHGSRCPYCSLSKGERKISEYLDKEIIKTINHYSFPDCKSKYRLTFDFAIFGEGDKLICLIEFDGKQHFEPVDFAGKGEKWANDKFFKTQFRDQIKNKYCEDNNISLLRIPYWEFDNIEEILENFLKRFNLN